VEEKVIWTIGHSTRTIEEFITLLNSFSIQLVADIRSYPGSRRFPHFNKELLNVTLADNHIEYIHLKDLGGRRKSKPESVNNGWRHEAFRGYADYMESDLFDYSIKELELLALGKRTAYMCSEALWWRCHRSMVSDWLKLKGWKVIHILGIGKSEEHPYTQPARIVDGKLMYTNE
jgi:uncharacterized protein (DUF488 family)